MNKFFKVIKSFWKANYKKPNFWISFVSFLFVAGFIIGKFAFKLNVSAADIAIGVSGIAAFLVFVGNATNNTIVTQIGENLDSTQISKTAEGVADSVAALEAEVKKLSSTTTNTKDTVKSVDAKTTAIASAVNADSSEDTSVADGKLTNVNITLDGNGNVAGVVAKTNGSDSATAEAKTE